MNKQELLQEITNRIYTLDKRLNDNGISYNSASGGILIGLSEAFDLIERELDE